MAMISLTPYSAFMVGGYTTSDGRRNINYWVYNPERTRFEKPLRFLQHRQNWNYWTRVGLGYKALANCEAERTYAAVGWGGTNQYTEWSVMLRKRWQSNTDIRKPATCHRHGGTLSLVQRHRDTVLSLVVADLSSLMP